MGIAVTFPGQGSQSPGMGAPWQDSPEWSLVTHAEAVLDHEVAPLLLDTDPKRLRHTREAQLAVFLTSLLAWESAKDALGEAGEVTAFAGHSLGQLTALTAAGVLDVDDAVRLVARRGELTQAAADANAGGMAALLGADESQAESACSAAPDACWLANDNAPGQIVVAGTEAGLADATEAARAAGVRKVVRLDVDGAFHTPLMQAAADGLQEALAGADFKPPTVPVVSNADAVAYTDAGEWRVRLVDHLVRPVLWRQSLDTLVGLGADTFVEVGPGRVLTGLARKSRPDVATELAPVPA
ncbi:MAG: ACP S-malonyltransferase [Acidimicrobiia bacterium]|nr:ACP S-malonyltransferase [Acidimicrobiia bacterium]